MTVHHLKAIDRAVKWKVKRGKPYGGKRQALTQDELDRLFAALKGNRHGHRDYMIALVTFLHGLRVSELIDLRWDDIDWRKGTIAIRRLKGSIDGTHYLNATKPLASSDCSASKTQATAHLHQRAREAFSRFAINKMIAPPGRTPRSPGRCIRIASGIPPARCRPTAAWMPGACQADGPCLDRQHHQIRQDEPGAVEGRLAGQTLTRAG